MDEPRQKAFVTVTSGMRGWFAIHYWWNPEGFYEPWETSIPSFRDQASAEPYAEQWAAELGLPYHPRS